MNISDLLSQDGFRCECGKKHYALVRKCVVCSGAIERIPEILKDAGVKSVFLLADLNTYGAAGQKVESVLSGAGIRVNKYVFNTKDPIFPDEKAVGSAVMHFVPSDAVVAVGSGVINDTGKILSAVANKPYMIVGTAPSMDGYASATSSMERDGLKISLPSKCPEYVIGDTDVLKDAPMEMIRAGVGDMLAKYISICEWRISELLNGEYYCEKIAGLVRTALGEVVSGADKLIDRDENAIKAVMNGMVLSGIAANYAGISRPVSGEEHYFSHVWDMKGENVRLHGIQCGAATVEKLKVYEFLRGITPDYDKARAYVKSFDFGAYSNKLREFIPGGAQTMIDLEKKEGKYDADRHDERVKKIIAHWDEIVANMDDELPPRQKVEELLCSMGAPASAAEIGKTPLETAKTLHFSKDIRDKYVGTRLLWDLGVIDEATYALYGVKNI